MLEINNRDLKGRFFLADSIEPGNEVDHAAVSPAAKAMKPLVHLHAGLPIIVKRTSAHAVLADFQPIKRSSLSCRDGLLHSFKNIWF